MPVVSFVNTIIKNHFIKRERWEERKRGRISKNTRKEIEVGKSKKRKKPQWLTQLRALGCYMVWRHMHAPSIYSYHSGKSYSILVHTDKREYIKRVKLTTCITLSVQSEHNIIAISRHFAHPRAAVLVSSPNHAHGSGNGNANESGLGRACSTS